MRQVTLALALDVTLQRVALAQVGYSQGLRPVVAVSPVEVTRELMMEHDEGSDVLERAKVFHHLTGVVEDRGELDHEALSIASRIV